MLFISLGIVMLSLSVSPPRHYHNTAKPKVPYLMNLSTERESVISHRPPVRPSAATQRSTVHAHYVILPAPVPTPPWQIQPSIMHASWATLSPIIMSMPKGENKHKMADF